MNEIIEAGSVLAGMKSGFDIVMGAIAVLSLAICAVRLITASDADDRRKVKVTFISVLGAYILYILTPHVITFMAQIAQTLRT